MAVEIVAIDDIFRSSKEMPNFYRSWKFWLIRIVLACAAGALAVGYDIANLIAAAQIGAPAPLIIKSLSKFHRR